MQVGLIPENCTKMGGLNCQITPLQRNRFERDQPHLSLRLCFEIQTSDAPRWTQNPPTAPTEETHGPRLSVSLSLSLSSSSARNHYLCPSLILTAPLSLSKQSYSLSSWDLSLLSNNKASCVFCWSKTLPLMGASGKWVKAIIGVKKPDKDDHVNSIFHFSVTSIPLLALRKNSKESLS